MPRLVTPDELMAALYQWPILDVREKQAYAQNHILGARWMDIDSPLETADAQFDKQQPFILYDEDDCDMRAEVVATGLQSSGFTGVATLHGGFNAWREHHYPCEQAVTASSNTDR